MKRISTYSDYRRDGTVVLDADGIIVNVTDQNFRGVGFPEGKVSAPVGAIYTDTAATAGAVRWIKTSGTGTTGWAVEYGDTGLRELFSADTHDSITSGRILIRRISGTVFLYVNEVQFSLEAPGFGALPNGFRGETVTKPGETMSGVWPVTDGSFVVSALGYLNFYRVPTDKPVNALLTYSTQGPWPTTLPGTPA